MAGVAAITVVVEAADPSGSLITSVFAANLGRTVAAVPGRVTSRVSAGSNRLLADGARMVTCAQDVLDELDGVGSSGPRGTGTHDASGRGARAPTVAADPVEERVLDALEAGLGRTACAPIPGFPRARRARFSRAWRQPAGSAGTDWAAIDARRRAGERGALNIHDVLRAAVAAAR